MPIPRNKKEIQNVVLNRVINDSVSYYYYFQIYSMIDCSASDAATLQYTYPGI